MDRLSTPHSPKTFEEYLGPKGSNQGIPSIMTNMLNKSILRDGSAHKDGSAISNVSKDIEVLPPKESDDRPFADLTSVVPVNSVPPA